MVFLIIIAKYLTNTKIVMRKNLLLLFAGVMLAMGYLNAQVMYSDDFESFTTGTGIAQQETTWWSTWNVAPGGAEDPKISETYAHVGTKSVKVSGTNDGIVKLNDLTTGRYRIEFYMYIPAGKQGYYNILQNFNGANSTWGMQVYLKNGIITIDGAGESAATSSYIPGEWFKVQHFIDLNSDWVDMYINGILVHAYQWSKGTFDDGTGINKLDAFNFYAWGDDGGTPEYYMDNFLIEEVETPYAPEDFAYTLENGNDVVLTWTAPTEGTPENYSIARNGTVIGTTTELTLTDVNIYPNTYEYSLLAYYGTSSGYSAALPLAVTVAGGNERNLMVYEIFTSVGCSYCPRAAGAADEVIADGNNAAVIEYHISGFGPDPFFITSSDEKENYYKPFYDTESDGSLGYPGVVFNGEAAIEGATSSVATMKDLYMYHYNEIITKPSVYTLSAYADPISTSPYVFNLNISLEETFPYFTEEMRLVVALTETEIAYAWQSESQVNFVNRGMYPDANGTILDFSSQSTFSTVIPITIDPSWNVNNCEIVAYIQKWDDAYIQQATKVSLYSFTNNEIANQFTTSVYPNPANSVLNVVADENINNIEVLNMAGQVISKINPNSGNVQFNVSGFAAGVYFVKVYTQSEVTIHKITVE